MRISSLATGEPGSGNRYRLKIYHEGTKIGDYEESIEKNLERKER